METQIVEYKSLKKITSGSSGLKELAKTCVCLANAQGGIVSIGIEDKSKEPPAKQRLKQNQINDTLERLRGFTFSVGLSPSEILTHENGGEYFNITVFPSQKIVATTSDGKIFLRIGDRCEPIQGEDLQRIVSEKDAFQWELVQRNIDLSNIPTHNIESLINDLRKSNRVKDSIKEKSDIEILEHYNLIENSSLTNLGVLWLGTAQQRSRIAYPITVQYIVYDALEQKTRKHIWDDYELNPKELLFSIEKEAVELNYSYEFPDGLFRKQVRHYPEAVIRELLINAFAHKSYLISADITIEVYPNRITITSPGSLPLGITSNNILHEKHRRNPHLIKLLHDLKLMEGEGSGYDLIYEKLSTDAKEFPVIESDFNKVSVSLQSEIIDLEALRLTDYIAKHYQLTQREKIVIGIVARHKKILSTDLSKVLQLAEDERLRSWTAKLTDNSLLISRGIKKGNEFLINPELLKSSKLNISPSLKTIEPYRLQALIETDLQTYPNSSIRDIQGRLPDVDIRDIRKVIYQMVDDGKLSTAGALKNRTYSLA